MKHATPSSTLALLCVLALSYSTTPSIAHASGTESGSAGAASEDRQDSKRDDQRDERREERRERLKKQRKTETSNQGASSDSQTSPSQKVDKSASDTETK